MCCVDSNDRTNPSGPYYASSGDDRPLPYTSCIDSRESLGHTINFIDNWLQCFEDNHWERTGLYKKNVRKLLQ